MKELARQMRLIRDLRRHLLPRRVLQPLGWRLAVKERIVAPAAPHPR